MDNSLFNIVSSFSLSVPLPPKGREKRGREKREERSNIYNREYHFLAIKNYTQYLMVEREEKESP
jgi:hypothetical protein|tara:strand:- start:112 stop:306 length:195 start_codon:yes stop_codon:yes gene_type:complete